MRRGIIGQAKVFPDDMQSYLPKLKRQYPWLAEVNSQSLQIVCHNLADAFNRFFKKQAKYPARKRKHDRLGFTAVTNTYVRDNHVRLPKLGLIRFRGGDMPAGKMKRVTVRKSADKYYASILIETDGVEAKVCPFSQVTGIDLGLIEMVVTSKGQTFKAHKHFARSKAKLRAANKRVARAKKGSNRQAKAKIALARVNEKIRNQRKDSNHKISRILVDDSENQAFGIENLNVKGLMANKSIASAVADAAWWQFLTFLKYKAASVGKPVIEVDRFFPSSKTCSECGVVNRELNRKQRAWTCADCGAVHHRDINAARNIALEAARNAVRRDGVRPGLAPAAVAEAKLRAFG